MIDLVELPDGRAAWNELWAQTGHEPAAHPSYSEVFAGPGEQPVLVAYRTAQALGVVPLLLRPLPDGHEGFDAVSPYGYGGPFCMGTLEEEELLHALAHWAQDRGLVSVLLRLSLGSSLPPGELASGWEVVSPMDNVIVGLQRTPEEIWASYEHKVRKNVKKALRAGCQVRRTEGFDDVDEFLEVYQGTMRRRGAGSWYHFDRDFFTSIADELRGSFSVFTVTGPESKAVSVELVLESDSRLYSFLGGTLAEAFPYAPNDLLKHEVVLHGQRTGRTGFVLGGGLGPDDGIFRYKRSFDPSGVQPFRVARLVGDRQRYDDLSRGRGTPSNGFFPAYRAS